MEASANRVVLTLPLKPEFVGIARLTVSGVANRAGFDIDAVEDIKVAAAEVCNKIVIKGCGAPAPDSYTLIFEIRRDALAITFESTLKGLGCLFGGDDDELGLSIINAFMDRVEFCKDDSFILTMIKNLPAAKSAEGAC